MPLAASLNEQSKHSKLMFLHVPFETILSLPDICDLLGPRLISGLLLFLCSLFDSLFFPFASLQDWTTTKTQPAWLHRTKSPSHPLLHLQKTRKKLKILRIPVCFGFSSFIATLIHPLFSVFLFFSALFSHPGCCTRFHRFISARILFVHATIANFARAHSLVYLLLFAARKLHSLDFWLHGLAFLSSFHLFIACCIDFSCAFLQWVLLGAALSRIISSCPTLTLWLASLQCPTCSSLFFSSSFLA